MKKSWMVLGVALAATVVLAGCEKMKSEEGATTAAPAAEATPAVETGVLTPGTAGTIAVATAAGPVNFTVEIAKSDDQKAVGLMNRESLAENSGMWFDFSDKGMGVYPFWMKDTLVNLDWIFVDDQKKIVHVKAMNTAGDETKYESPKPFLYVLEIGAGEAAKKGIKEGDAVEVRIGN